MKQLYLIPVIAVLVGLILIHDSAAFMELNNVFTAAAVFRGVLGSIITACGVMGLIMDETKGSDEVDETGRTAKG